MGSEIDITIKATDEASAEMKKAAQETEKLDAALLKLAQSEARQQEAAKAAEAFSKLSDEEKKAMLAADALQKEQEQLAQSTKAAGDAAGKGGLSITNLSQASQLAGNIMRDLGQAQQMYNQVVDATIGKTAAYAAEVSSLSRITGQSTEETSRVIQVFDDMGVSTQQLEAATKKLSADGLSLNISTLAQLSDEYNKLAPGSERAAFLTDKFGKSGLDMARAMEQGGSALRAMAAEQSGALILTEKQAQAYQDWTMSVDSAEDATASFAAAMGNALAPAVTEFNNAWAEGMSGWAAFITGVDNMAQAAKRNSDIMTAADKIMEQYGSHVEMVGRVGHNVSNATEEQRQAAIALATEQWNLAHATDGVSKANDAAAMSAEQSKAKEEEAAKAYQEAMNIMTAANQEFLSLLGQVSSAEQANAEQMAALDEQRAAAQEKINTLTAQGYQNVEGSPLSKAVEDLAAIDEKITSTAANYEAGINQMIAADLLKRLSVDGLTDGETAYFEQVQLQMGLITQAQIDQAQKIRDAAAELAAAAPGAVAGGAPAPVTPPVPVDVAPLENYKKASDEVILQQTAVQTAFSANQKAYADAGLAEKDFLTGGMNNWELYTAQVTGNLQTLIDKIAEYVNGLLQIPPTINTVVSVEGLT